MNVTDEPGQPTVLGICHERVKGDLAVAVRNLPTEIRTIHGIGSERDIGVRLG